MRLTDHTDYSLRVLMYLNQKKSMVTLAELSGKIGVSRNNLIKVSHQLAKLGLIETTRGRAGGLVIKEGTGRKSLKDIVTRTEESFRMADCFANEKCDCAFLRGCLLQKSLAEALQAFLGALAKKTLDEVTPRG